MDELLQKMGDHWFLFLGMPAQLAFLSRFVIQWIASERRKASVIPERFWWLSLGGGACLLVYALHRADIVFIVGQAAGILVYARNLVLIRRGRKPTPT